MGEIHLTSHAMQRLRQRGFFNQDVQLVMRFGTEIPDGIMLRDKDVQTVVQDLKRLIERLHRLSGVCVIAEGATVVTCYRPDRRRERRFLERHYRD